MAHNARVRVLAFPADDFACGQWRVIQPALAMRDHRVEVNLMRGQNIDPAGFDVVQLQRVLWPQQVGLIREIKGIGKKLVIDYDDAFPITDASHADYEYYAPGSETARALEEVLALTDAVTVPTPELLCHYRGMHPRVVLLPNAVDLEGPVYRAGRMARASEKLTVFWSGWDSHEANLRMVEPAITRLLVERDDVVFVLCGPGEFVDIFNTVRRMKKLIHVPRMAYEAFARAASMADVAIAPLGQTAFNGNKSEIRLIEAGAWGVPVVASAVAPYRRFESGQGACLLVEGNDVNGWYAALTRLLDDAEMRRTMGFIARITVATRYHLPAVNSARAELWASV